MAELIHWKPTQTQLVSALAKLHAPPSLLYSGYIPWGSSGEFSLTRIESVIYKHWATSPFALIRQDKKLAGGCSAGEYPEEGPVCPPLAACLTSLLSLWPLISGPDSVLSELSSHHKSLPPSSVRLLLQHHLQASQAPFPDPAWPVNQYYWRVTPFNLRKQSGVLSPFCFTKKSCDLTKNPSKDKKEVVSPHTGC